MDVINVGIASPVRCAAVFEDIKEASAKLIVDAGIMVSAMQIMNAFATKAGASPSQAVSGTVIL